MGASAPPIDELRREAERLGVRPTDEDLERVRSFLEVLLPAISELERLVTAETSPAALFRPEDEP
jgi:hypothetical protein